MLRTSISVAKMVVPLFPMLGSNELSGGCKLQSRDRNSQDQFQPTEIHSQIVDEFAAPTLGSFIPAIGASSFADAATAAGCIVSSVMIAACCWSWNQVGKWTGGWKC